MSSTRAARRRVVIVAARQAPPALDAGWSWIYLGENAADYFSARARFLDRAREIPAGPLLNDIVDEFRDDLLNFDAVIEPRSELRWQATDLAERSLFTSGFLHACCCALALDRLLDSTDGNVLVLVNDMLLGRRLADIARTRGYDVTYSARPVAIAWGRLAARGLAHRVYFFGRWVVTRRSIRRRLGARRPRPSLDTLLVTWADPETFPEGAVVERDTFFGMLPNELRAGGRTVGFLANLTTWVYRRDDILRNVAAAGDPVVVPEEAVDLRDAVAIVLQSLLAPARLRGRFVVGRLDLSGLVADELAREWSKFRQLWALQFFSIGRFFAKTGRPAEVIFPFENQSWEKALRLGFRSALPDSKIAGFQHTPVSEHWFPYFPSQRDLEAGELPDRVLTIGQFWRRRFEGHGYPPERLEIVPAYRHAHLADSVPARIRTEGETANVLVAGSIGQSDSLELVVKALQALEPVPSVSVRIRLHPKLGVEQAAFAERVVNVLGMSTLPSNVSFESGSTINALRDADVVLYNTTSVSYEALAAGVALIFVASDFWFDVDPLPAAAGLREIARTPEEIRAAVETLLDESGDDAAARRERARRFLEDALAVMSPAAKGDT